MKTKHLAMLLLCALLSVPAMAQVFPLTFESGSMSPYVTISGNPLQQSTVPTVVNNDLTTGINASGKCVTVVSNAAPNWQQNGVIIRPADNSQMSIAASNGYLHFKFRKSIVGKNWVLYSLKNDGTPDVEIAANSVKAANVWEEFVVNVASKVSSTYGFALALNSDTSSTVPSITYYLDDIDMNANAGTGGAFFPLTFETNSIPANAAIYGSRNPGEQVFGPAVVSNDLKAGVNTTDYTLKITSAAGTSTPPPVWNTNILYIRPADNSLISITDANAYLHFKFKKTDRVSQEWLVYNLNQNGTMGSVNYGRGTIAAANTWYNITLNVKSLTASTYGFAIVLNGNWSADATMPEISFYVDELKLNNDDGTGIVQDPNKLFSFEHDSLTNARATCTAPYSPASSGYTVDFRANNPKKDYLNSSDKVSLFADNKVAGQVWYQGFLFTFKTPIDTTGKRYFHTLVKVNRTPSAGLNISPNNKDVTFTATTEWVDYVVDLKTFGNPISNAYYKLNHPNAKVDSTWIDEIVMDNNPNKRVALVMTSLDADYHVNDRIGVLTVPAGATIDNLTAKLSFNGEGTYKGSFELKQANGTTNATDVQNGYKLMASSNLGVSKKTYTIEIFNPADVSLKSVGNYSVNGKNIENIPNNKEVVLSDFYDNIVVAFRATYQLYQANGSTQAQDVRNGYKFVVTSADGTTTDTYTLVIPQNSENYVASDVYVVSSDAVGRVPVGTSLAAFKSHLSPAYLATFQVYQANGTTVATDLQNGYKVKVVAESGAEKIYTVNLFTPGEHGIYCSYSLRDTTLTDDLEHTSMFLRNGAELIVDATRGPVAKIDNTKKGYLVFDGLPFNTDKFTFAFFVNPSVYGDWSQLFEVYSAKDNSNFYLTPQTGAAVQVPTLVSEGINAGIANTKIAATGSTLPKNKWSHVAITVNNTEFTIYLNGVKVLNSATFATPMTIRPDSLFLGHNPHRAGAAPMAALYDEIRLYDDVLTENQVTAIAAGSKIPDPVDPSLPYVWLKLDGTVEDFAGNVTVTSSSVTFVDDAAHGKVGAFDSNSDNIKITKDPLGGSKFDIGFWYYHQENNSNNVILKFQQDADNYVALHPAVDNEGTSFLTLLANQAGNISVIQRSTLTLASNTWYYLYWSQNDTLCSLYLNNTLIGGAAKKLDIAAFTFTKWSIGDGAGVNTNKSRVDDVRIYHRNLSAAQRADLHSATAAVLTLAVDLAAKKQTIRNFGSSDGWNTERIGKYWPVEQREQIAELLFSTENDADGTPKGIGLSSWRFNIGAGTAEQGDASRISNVSSRTEGFLKDNGTYDWGKQAGQRWFLEKAAKQYKVADIIGWQNSPPVQYTRNNLGFNDRDAHYSILLAENYHKFSGFIADVVTHFKNEGINFKYITPLNEPQWKWAPTVYGTGTVTQEGTPWQNSEIAKVVKSLDSTFTARAINTTKLFIPEAGRSDYLYAQPGSHAGDQLKKFWKPGYVGTLNQGNCYIGDRPNLAKIAAYHSYYTDKSATEIVNTRKALRDSIQKIDPSIEPWQTEYSLLDVGYQYNNSARTEMSNALALLRVVHADLTVAGTSGWQWWTTFEKGKFYNESRFALIEVMASDDNSQTVYHPTKLFYSFGNYSRFVRPGMQRVDVNTGIDDTSAVKTQGVSAYVKGDTLVIVAINHSTQSKDLKFDFSGVTAGKSIVKLTPYVTSATENLQRRQLFSAAQGYMMAPQSVVTFVGVMESPKSSDASITSAAYLVNQAEATITGMAYNVNLAPFRANITPAAGATFKVKAAINSVAEVAAVSTGNVVVVTAEDGITTKAYTIITGLSSQAYVTSTVYTVRNDSVLNIPYGTSLATFKSNLQPAYGCTFEVYQANGTTVATALATGYKVIATAQDGTTTKTYVVIINKNTQAFVTSLVYTIDNTNDSITHVPQSETLSNFKANLTPAPAAAFEVYQPNGTTVATDLQTGYKVKVTAENGTTTKVYTVRKLIAQSSAARVVSAVYTVNDADSTIKQVPYGETLLAFKSKVTAAEGGSYVVKVANLSAEATDLQTGYKVVATAENGVNRKTYTITVNAALTGDTLYSSVYTVNYAAGTVTNVPYGANLATFKSNIRAAQGASHEVYESNGTTVATTLATGCKVKVTAQSGASKLYAITVNKNNLATVTSTAYTVNDVANRITNVPFAVAKATFLAALTPAAGATMELMQEDGTTIATDVRTGYKLVVTAENEATSKTYTVETTASNEAFVASTVYTVNDADGTITNVPADEMLTNFKRNLTPAAGATFVVKTAAAASGQATDLKTGYVVIVTAEDGATQKTYTITLSNAPITGINDNTVGSVAAYPNPFGGELMVKGADAIVSVVLRASNGVVLLERSLSNNMGELKLNTAALPSGIYLLTVKYANGKQASTMLTK